tara:strand:- start:246 stop:557 length:312 start_codon:yes stop_codon:yes gene_type:complete
MLNDSNFIYFDPLLLSVDTQERRLPLEWEDSNSIIFIDFGDSLISYRDGYSSNKDLWLIYHNIKGVFVSHFSRNSFIEILNNNNSNKIFSKLINPIQNQVNEI